MRKWSKKSPKYLEGRDQSRKKAVAIKKNNTLTFSKNVPWSWKTLGEKSEKLEQNLDLKKYTEIAKKHDQEKWLKNLKSRRNQKFTTDIDHQKARPKSEKSMIEKIKSLDDQKMLPKSLKIVVEILKSLILILVKSDRELDFFSQLDHKISLWSLKSYT